MAMPIQIRVCAHAMVGRLLEASLSGALLSTPMRIPVYSQMLIEGAGDQPFAARRHWWRVSAHVIRTTSTGVAVEWAEFAPRAIVDLLQDNRLYDREKTQALR